MENEYPNVLILISNFIHMLHSKRHYKLSLVLRSYVWKDKLSAHHIHPWLGWMNTTMLRHFHFTVSQKLIKWYNNKPEIGKFNQKMFFLQSFSFFFYRRQRIKCPWDTIILIGVTRIHSRESHHVNFIWAIHQPRGSYINWLFFFLQVMTPQISMLDRY